jgi:hypothetical protein
MRFSESYHPVYALKPADHAAGVDFDSINLGLGHTLCFMIAFAALTGDAVLTVNSGATAGTKTTAETFNYRLADAVQGAASGDLFAAWSTSAALTLTAATYANKLLIVEIDARALTDGQNWVTGTLSAAASALNAAVTAIVEPRYPAHDGPTML